MFGSNLDFPKFDFWNFIQAKKIIHNISEEKKFGGGGVRQNITNVTYFFNPSLTIPGFLSMFLTLLWTKTRPEVYSWPLNIKARDKKGS